MKELRLSVGYRAYNGHIFSQADCDFYNRCTDDVERNRNYPAGLQRCLDRRNKAFKIIIGHP
jgi:hypothetical protein